MIDYKLFQRDDVGQGMLTMICQSLPSAAIYAMIYSLYVISIAATSIDGVEDPPNNISDWIKAVDLLLPNIIRGDQKIDPILKLFIEGMLPYYISSIGHNLYTALIPDLPGDESMLRNFKTRIIEKVDEITQDGPDEDRSSYTTNLYGGYRRFVDGLASVLKMNVFESPKTELGVGLMFFQCEQADRELNEFFVFTSFPTVNIDVVFLVFVTLMRRFLYCHPWTIIPFWAVRRRDSVLTPRSCRLCAYVVGRTDQITFTDPVLTLFVAPTSVPWPDSGQEYRWFKDNPILSYPVIDWDEHFNLQRKDVATDVASFKASRGSKRVMRNGIIFIVPRDVSDDVTMQEIEMSNAEAFKEANSRLVTANNI